MKYTKAQKTELFVVLALLLLALILAIILIPNVGVASGIKDAGGCISVSFDKWDMMHADKLVIKIGAAEYITTDTDFIQQFARETLAGTHSDYCCARTEYDKWIEIYKGDRLIRRMRWIQNHDAIAYEADAGHWVLFGEEGHSFLSNDTRRTLYEMIGEEVFF